MRVLILLVIIVSLFSCSGNTNDRQLSRYKKLKNDLISTNRFQGTSMELSYVPSSAVFQHAGGSDVGKDPAFYCFRLQIRNNGVQKATPAEFRQLLYPSDSTFFVSSGNEAILPAFIHPVNKGGASNMEYLIAFPRAELDNLGEMITIGFQDILYSNSQQTFQIKKRAIQSIENSAS